MTRKVELLKYVMVDWIFSLAQWKSGILIEMPFSDLTCPDFHPGVRSQGFPYC